jgi:CSLREA domain-containing protein
MVAVLLAICTSAASAQGPTFTVNSTDDVDDGTCNQAHCSLREAINAANGAVGEVLIAFNIPGPGPHSILPTSSLPTLVVPTHVDGNTEPDFAGTPVVEIDGSLAGGGVTWGLSLGASNSSVRGVVVNRFSGFGVEIVGEVTGGVIEGCYLGTDITGTVSLGSSAGIYIKGGAGHRVGGPSPSQRNVISGNAFGIILGELSEDNRVFGNHIGTNAAGDQAIANQTGVDIRGADNVIGGEESGEGNVISGNGTGVLLSDANSTGNYIVGNLIGTDPTGSFPIRNSTGILVRVMGGSTNANNTIGGMNPAARNIISGNIEGIRIAEVSGNAVIGNYIGTDLTGLVAIPNQIGVVVMASGNTVGGFTPGMGNVISGNSSGGIIFRQPQVQSTESLVQGNLIGVDVTGSGELGNGGDGITLEEEFSNVRIGGEDPGAGNTIAYNGAAGILLRAGAGTGNVIRGNSIFSNGGLGVDLMGIEGVDPNDPSDTDTGPNQLQNYPLVMAAPTQGAILAKAIMINSLPNEPLTFEFFENDSCDPSGHGEGKTPLFWTQITSAADGDASMSGVTSGVTHLTATTTDGSGNTSEFSACVPLTDFNMLVSPATRTVSAGTSADYTLTLGALGGPFNDAIELECSGNPAGTTCTFIEPELIPYQGDDSTVMTVTTLGPQGASMDWVFPPGAWLVMVAIGGLVLVGSRAIIRTRGKDRGIPVGRAVPAWLAAGVLILACQVACGDGATEPPPGGTPPGTYELTITGTWETLSHSTAVTLVVN